MKIVFGVLISCLISLQACQTRQGNKSLEQKVAEAYGIEHFKNIKHLAFTFRVKKDTAEHSRHWNWDIANQTVSLTSDKENITYRRDTIKSEQMKSVDQKFINDQYWLLFPFHLIWDKGMSMEYKDKVSSPIRHQESKLLTVQFDKNVGYTPGDAYDLYVDPNKHLITEWSYRAGGASTPTITTTWEDIKEFKGLKIAENHLSADNNFRVWFTDIKVD
ncbi:MAG TPA: hypothetical protein VEV16_06275 [Daejeonella sp.]|nr:hypothetical protein [Daejeonella sp.]